MIFGEGSFRGLVTGPGVLALAFLVRGSPSLPAQERGDLEVAARAVAESWQEGRSDDLADRMVAEGIRLHLPTASHPVLPVRLARAALRALHDESGQGPVSVRQLRLLGGSPARGFAEMTWSPLPDGMTEPLRYTVFAGLEQRSDGWRIVEIRVIPAGGGRAERAATDGSTTYPETDLPWR